MTERSTLPPTRPLVVAHRAGNSIQTARAAHDAGADLVEADLWFDRGHIEVRHTKTIGAIPLLWDRWFIAPGWTPRLHFDELLDGIALETGLLLDLKGRDARLPHALAGALARSHHQGAVAVCSRNWHLLDPLADQEAIVLLYSAGNRRELDALLAETPASCGGVSVHRRLLDATTVRRLKDVAPLVLTWPVNDRATLRDLVDWGIDGITTDKLEIAREVASRR